MSCYKWDSCKSDDSVVIWCLYLACWVIRTGVTSCEVNHAKRITDETASTGLRTGKVRSCCTGGPEAQELAALTPSTPHCRWGFVPHLGSWHNSSSSGRNISCKRYTWQTATRPQIMAGHTPGFRAGSDRVSQHGLTQRTLYFSLKQKSQTMLFSKAGLPFNSLSLTLPVGCTLPSLSYGFIPVVPHFLQLRAPSGPQRCALRLLVLIPMCWLSLCDKC